jgi:hypothetical protein
MQQRVDWVFSTNSFVFMFCRMGSSCQLLCSVSWSAEGCMLLLLLLLLLQ